jgi:RND family efflux transporter MFP subunit
MNPASKPPFDVPVAHPSPVAFALFVALVLQSPSLWAQTSNVSTRPTPTMIYEGFTEPRHDIMVAATEIGRIESLTVEVGDHVQAGQEIGQLEDALQASSVQIAQHQASMTGELDATGAEVELHQSRTQSLRKLAADGMARPDELSRAETDLRIAIAKYAAAKEQLELRKLELERYELQLQRRKILVPMDGVISRLFHKPGEYITPGDPAVVRLLVTDKLFAVFNIPVEDTAVIHVGSSVKVHLRSSSRTLDASVTSIAPDIDGESGTVQVRVELDNADRSLLVGDRCTLRLAAETIPSRAELPAGTTQTRRTAVR